MDRIDYLAKRQKLEKGFQEYQHQTEYQQPVDHLNTEYQRQVYQHSNIMGSDISRNTGVREDPSIKVAADCLEPTNGVLSFEPRHNGVIDIPIVDRSVQATPPGTEVVNRSTCSADSDQEPRVDIRSRSQSLDRSAPMWKRWNKPKKNGEATQEENQGVNNHNGKEDQRDNMQAKTSGSENSTSKVVSFKDDVTVHELPSNQETPLDKMLEFECLQRDLKPVEQNFDILKLTKEMSEKTFSRLAELEQELDAQKLMLKKRIMQSIKQRRDDQTKIQTLKLEMSHLTQKYNMLKKEGNESKFQMREMRDMILDLKRRDRDNEEERHRLIMDAHKNIVAAATERNRYANENRFLKRTLQEKEMQIRANRDCYEKELTKFSDYEDIKLELSDLQDRLETSLEALSAIKRQYSIRTCVLSTIDVTCSQCNKTTPVSEITGLTVCSCRMCTTCFANHFRSVILDGDVTRFSCPACTARHIGNSYLLEEHYSDVTVMLDGYLEADIIENFQWQAREHVNQLAMQEEAERDEAGCNRSSESDADEEQTRKLDQGGCTQEENEDHKNTGKQEERNAVGPMDSSRNESCVSTSKSSNSNTENKQLDHQNISFNYTSEGHSNDHNADCSQSSSRLQRQCGSIATDKHSNCVAPDNRNEMHQKEHCNNSTVEDESLGSKLGVPGGITRDDRNRSASTDGEDEGLWF